MIRNKEKQWMGYGMTYPCEYVIRIFKGSYPRLNFDKASFKDKKICDIGCGDGRNEVLLSQCGFDVYGVEITEELVNSIKFNLRKVGVKADIRVGTNDRLPFEDEYFDYLLLWNACYYMGELRDFGKHVAEFARVLKPAGYLVLSIPKKTCFIYCGSDTLKPGYQIIRNDPFNVRNGQVLRMFESEEEIKEEFSGHFENFVFGLVEDDCFGYDYHWHMVVCQKR